MTKAKKRLKKGKRDGKKRAAGVGRAGRQRKGRTRPKMAKGERLSRFYAGLRKIIDPHTGMNIVDMGMIKNVKVNGDIVELDFTPTSPFCPVIHYFVHAIDAAAQKAGFKECKTTVKA